ncbi:hypothetical protein COLO4_38169 [Corchorus olitorius]|uniref:Aminotransferase-like plant mobile domain-containing protein n=1 Tax=Corchorus olitorius TaxID=93759 RepID=A0A1R3FWU7_9ROSI|nr:hypothetical protein COLO4_38169 [Corchorus olitorius]
MKSRASTAATAEVQRFRGLDPSPAVDAAELPLPQGLNRACYGNGELLPAPLQFEHPARAQSAWATWTREVLEDVAFSDLLRNAGVLPSIILSRHAYYTKDNLAMKHLVRLWHKDTHTFIFAFGEVGITLEDVINLTLLPLHGANDLDVIRTLSMVENNKHDILLTIRSQPGALKSPSLKEWCQHFVTGKGVNSAVRREAFVLAWLTIIFGAFSENRIMMQLAPIAIRIAVEGSFPLAPLYLENYPRYVGSRALRESVLKEDAYGDDWNVFAGFATGTYPAVCGWKGKRYNESKVSFLEVMDEEKEFCWRPYIKSDSRQHWLVFYPLMPNTPADKTFEMGVTSEDTLVFGAVYATGRVPFLSLLNHTFQTTPYPMYRVKRQFGLNQRVPSVLPRSDSWGDCIAAFQHSRSFFVLISKNSPYYVVGSQYQPVMTSETIAYWRRFNYSLGTYMNSSRNHLTPTIEGNPRLLPLSRSVLSSLERNNGALIARAPTGWYAYGVKDGMPLPAGIQQPFLPFPPPISKNKDNVNVESS